MTDNSPLFSVIIPTKNRLPLLKEAVASVLSQTYGDFELMVVDDGSEDGTVEWLEGIDDGRVVWMRNEGAGQSSAQNNGIKNSCGKNICLLDDDDFYDIKLLENFKLNLEANTILRTRFRKINSNGRIILDTKFNMKKHKNPINYFVYNMCGAWTLCIPRSVIIGTNFDERFTNWQDTHFLIRLFLNNKNVKLSQLESINYNYRIHDNMGSLKSLNMENVKEEYKINILAMKDLFSQYPDVNLYLPKNTLEFILAQKAFQYALNIYKNKDSSWKYFYHESIRNGFFIKLWKLYLLGILKTLNLK